MEERDPQPFKFKIYSFAPDWVNLMGGAKSRSLCLDHLRKVKQENPAYVCIYMGRDGRAEPKLIENIR